MSHKLIKINNNLYNIRYLKCIECDDKKCIVEIASTQPRYADKFITCNKNTYCYNDLIKFINDM